MVADLGPVKDLGPVRIWDPVKMVRRTTIPAGRQAGLVEYRLSPDGDGRTVISASDQGVVDTTTGERVVQPNSAWIFR